MRILALLTLLLSSQAFATGGFDCATKDGSVAISGTTGRFYGNPLIGELILTVDGAEAKISKDHILGYWNMDTELKLIAIDEEYVEPVVTLKVKQSRFSDKFKGTIQLKDRTEKIECIVE
ncbi:MAG: hypothetical protein COW00_12950 [Bdellovibrio sp. CG12_big_fil_rev_8_21_14_0_65_39_13]|nr:MAG: hypothetical protein COW78_05270 [Bdellovibrio sp. CG22_combo_CG10-13_8_21_14_all_39_27]PIQ58988.1 MAG: hypothetical protein COW00_12950 [Bdellovibrio sp. CG12_big_fil_rev_8_21_14_0_65_39_13]PIR33955.1 MAG: hypothetical protein COV37_14665 [Bdellovibrio sp. CG11_big_fil_rev_8_21_14_0_20_39_38]PJB52941.1 MAG: hypothetical protein CO099_09870 [Bdellovibrio sp. CG_4_9_14_3_um_filter_39_7]